MPALDEDGPRLLEAFRRLGAQALPRVWDDPSVTWDGFDAVLVRSPWDYPLRRDEFLAWTRGVPCLTNPADVLAWNTDKRYLQSLARAGLATVPTEFLPPGTTLPPQDAEFVVKPSVSGSAADTGRFAPGAAGLAADLLAAIHRSGRTAMVQPYLPGIEETGETSLVYLGGRLSHTVRRQALLTQNGVRPPVTVADVLRAVQPATPTSAELELAAGALAAVPGGPGRLSYARVDLIPGPDGPVLIELEATDCFLFLGFASPEAVGRLARHVLAGAAGGQR